jgi:hypothetical protein
MKVEQQEPVIRFTVEVTAIEWTALRRELQELITFNEEDNDDSGFPYIQQLLTNMNVA